VSLEVGYGKIAMPTSWPRKLRKCVIHLVGLGLVCFFIASTWVWWPCPSVDIQSRVASPKVSRQLPQRQIRAARANVCSHHTSFRPFVASYLRPFDPPSAPTFCRPNLNCFGIDCQGGPVRGSRSRSRSWSWSWSWSGSWLPGFPCGSTSLTCLTALVLFIFHSALSASCLSWQLLVYLRLSPATSSSFLGNPRKLFAI